jgi:hypothetical protein
MHQDGGAEKKGKAKAKGTKVAAAEVPQTDADKLAAALLQLEASSTRISALEQQCGRAVLERVGFRHSHPLSDMSCTG